MKARNMIHFVLIASLVLITGAFAVAAQDMDPALLTSQPEGQPDGATQQQAQNVQLVSQIGGPTFAVAVQSHYAYIGVGPRLVILDISNLAAPSVVGQTDVLPEKVMAVALSGDYAFVADGYRGLRIIDIADPAAPREVGYYDTPGSGEGIAVAGDYAYVADGESGLRIIDVSEVDCTN